MRLYAFTCGWLTGRTDLFLAGEPGRLRVPIPSFLIEHPRGTVLFDSGLHPTTQTDPVARLGPLAAGAFAVEFQPGEEVSGRLARLGHDAGRITFLVNSHLHFDHTGGNALIPNATLVVQRREWEAGADADLVARMFYDPKDYTLGHRVVAVDGEHDLFGDGRVVCVPTYGHTPGHQSLRVRLDDGTVVLTADACYLRRTLEALHLPRTVWNRDAALQSLRALQHLRDDGARIIYGHDPEAWQHVPAPPAAVGGAAAPA